MSYKTVDNLIDKYGVSAFSEDTPFLKRRQLKSSHALQKGMPFCFYRQLVELEAEDVMWCFTVYLPNKKQKLAMFLVNKHHEVTEQVYYPRDKRSVDACNKIGRLLRASLHAANAKDYTLAA